MKVLLIDNGTKLLTKLQDLIPGSEITKKWKDVLPTDSDDFDLIVLSGSSTSCIAWNHQDFENEIKLIKETKKPIIGICFGCELIAYAFNGTLKELFVPHEGIRKIEILDSNFSNKSELNVYEYHGWEIDKVPKDFTILARSKDGPEAIKHKKLPIYGLQFHPENFVDKTEGREVFLNLLTKLVGPKLEIKIQDAVPDDALEITNVFYKAWLATYPNKEKGVTVEDIEYSYKDEFSAEKIENLKEIIRDLPKNKKRLVAKEGDVVVGACTVIRNDNNNHLRTLYVLPEFQNKGIGTMLWNKAVEFLDPKKDTVVQVADYTENAISFYKKLGFVDTGKRTPQEGESFKSGAVIIDMEMVRKAE